MRGVKVFAGSSHPVLAEAICERLGAPPAKCLLGFFANGETRVEISTSIRNEDVFVVQSGSSKINDSVVELLVMISACKGGSAKSITAVMPYFPYSRQSKKKSHRGAITAKMLANLMVVAGVDHVITVDLHASQMQGFFGKPVDNLFAEPLIARWIKSNVPDWKRAVVVSKNVGGVKRVTSLADALKLSFAIISADRTRPQQHHSMLDSAMFFDAIEPQTLHSLARQDSNALDEEEENGEVEADSDKSSLKKTTASRTGFARLARPKIVKIASSPMVHAAQTVSSPPPEYTEDEPLTRVETAPSARRPSEYEANDELNDEKARDVIFGRLIHGHIVDDDHPSPSLSNISASMGGFAGDRSGSDDMGQAQDPMTSSFVSTSSSFQHEHADHALGGTGDAAASSDEEEENLRNPRLEHTITLVGKVKDRTVILMDDMIDKAGSWIAAAETCVKRGGAKKVYCIGVHALFGEDSLEEMEQCDCIDYIVVTNTFPITPLRLRESKKLIVIDLSNLLAEAIRRNHHGESISPLFHMQ